jgi:hypothetical protein
MVRRRTTVHKRESQMSPQAELAMYIKRDMGIDVDPEEIRKFVVGRFTTISILAHEMWEPTLPPGYPK